MKSNSCSRNRSGCGVSTRASMLPRCFIVWMTICSIRSSPNRKQAEEPEWPRFPLSLDALAKGRDEQDWRVKDREPRAGSAARDRADDEQRLLTRRHLVRQRLVG